MKITKLTNKSSQLKKVKVLNETRVPGLDYSLKWATKKAEKAGELADKVLLLLKGTDSARITRIANNFVKIKKIGEAIETKRIKLNQEATEIIENLFDAEDKVLTRVVETASVIFTLAKQNEKPSGKVQTPGQEHESRTTTDWEKVALELRPLLTETLVQAYESILQAYTVTAEPKKDNGGNPDARKKDALRVSVKESEILMEADAFVNKVVQAVDQWSKSYDHSLKQVKNT